jgi:hypothetical protein
VLVLPGGRGLQRCRPRWGIRQATGLTVLAAGSPTRQALVVQVVEEGCQELSGRHQAGVKVPGQFLDRVVALVCGDLAEHKVDIL